MLAVFMLFAIYNIVISVIFLSGNHGSRLQFYEELAIDWTEPELTAALSSLEGIEISALLTQRVEVPVYKRIGMENYPAGIAKVEKPFFVSQTRVELTEQLYSERAEYSEMEFYLPEELDPDEDNWAEYDRADPQNGSDWDDQTWERLDKIHAGNVATLGFSMYEGSSSKDMLSLFEPYDIDVLWLPIYMGENDAYIDEIWPRPWGLTGVRETSADFSSGSLTYGLHADELEESEKAMLKNMNWMLEDNPKLAEKLLETNHLQERYDYLQEHGFIAYGAVVTGPVKELLKLKEIDGLHSPMIGDITYWNWLEDTEIHNEEHH